MKFKLLTSVLAASSVAIIAFLGWASYRLVMATVDLLQRLQSDLAIAIVAGAATVVVSVVSVIAAKYLENRAIIRQELRGKKVPIYENIISTLFRLFMAEKVGDPAMTETELSKFFLLTTEQLTIWGSDGVVRAYRDLRKHFVTAPDMLGGMLLLENLMFAIRKDLGHRNVGLDKGSLLTLFINDIDEVLAGRKPAPTLSLPDQDSE